MSRSHAERTEMGLRCDENRGLLDSAAAAEEYAERVAAHGLSRMETRALLVAVFRAAVEDAFSSGRQYQHGEDVRAVERATTRAEALEYLGAEGS